MPFLIDGHNVIAALDDIDLEDPHDEAKLVMRLRSWSARTTRKAIVVFDGGLPGGPSPTLSTSDVKVIFAARHHTNADRVIDERVRALPDAENWTVVSSDREVRDRARDNGARTLTAQEFVEVLERPTSPEKEKPDTISADEVAAWLEIFTEPEEAPTPPVLQQEPLPPTVRPKGKGRQRRARSPESKPAINRRSATIGEQLGVDMAPAPPPPPPSGKPGEVSDAEIEAWLEVFHDDPESHIPPPMLPKKRKPASEPQKPAEPVVRKDGSLSDSEVDTWLSLFEARAAAESQHPGTSEDGPRTEEAQDSLSKTAHGKGDVPRTLPAARAPKPGRPKVSPTLAKHQEKRARHEDAASDKTGLSREDRELWHRLFDDEA